MPEQYRAVIVILVLATAVFAFGTAPACATAMQRNDFARRRNLWLAITITAFVANNFWIYIVVAATLLLIALPYESNRLAMFYFLLFAVPPISSEITGLGVINYFFAIDYMRLLSLAVLLPAYFSLRAQPDTPAFGKLWPDRFLGTLLIVQFCLMLGVSTVTNTLRVGAFYAFIDVFLPYYVASRSLRNLGEFRDALMAFGVAALVLSVIGMFEFLQHWLLYSTVDDELGVVWGYGGYLPRGATIRATASAGQPIVLGFIFAVALGVMLYLRKLIANPVTWYLAMLTLCGGLVASLSRGPWVGAAVMLLAFILTGRTPGKSIVQLVVLGLIAVPILLVTPAGHDIIDHLPFVGSIDAGNVTYRQRLFQISVQVIMEHPFFGAYDFFYSPAMQELKQGSEGFIDLVNTYAAVGLSSGLVGLSLFVGFFLSAAAGIFRSMRRLSDRDSESYLLGRAMLAVMVGIMVIIFTVSSITFVPIVYWSFAGIAVAYARMLVLQRAPAKAVGKRGATAQQPVPLRPAFYRNR